jgi:hypothetical protein
VRGGGGEHESALFEPPSATTSRLQGIPLGMVTLPKLLAPGGYRSYFYGKWDVGIYARICFTRFIGAIGGRCIGAIGMVYPGTLFHRRQRGIAIHSYENRSQIRALAPPPYISP